MAMYREASRLLQDAFGSRELADRLEKHFRHSTFTDADAEPGAHMGDIAAALVAMKQAGQASNRSAIAFLRAPDTGCVDLSDVEGFTSGQVAAAK